MSSTYACYAATISSIIGACAPGAKDWCSAKVVETKHFGLHVFLIILFRMNMMKQDIITLYILWKSLKKCKGLWVSLY